MGWHARPTNRGIHYLGMAAFSQRVNVASEKSAFESLRAL